MIYLIGGSPRSGKSILSKQLSKKLNISYISTDNLRPVVMSYFKGKNKYKNFPFEKMFSSAAVDEYFEKYTGQEMLSADIREAKTIWPGVKSLILHLLACNINYIIEGVHLLPNLVRQFEGTENIKIVFLVKLNKDKIYSGLLQNKNKGDWLIDNIKNKKNLLVAAESLCDYGKFFIREAKKYGFMCVTMEDDFFDKINKAYNYLK